MSYILNALRKSEQERQDKQSETLENRIEIKQNNEHKKTSSWIFVLVIANLFFLSYFIWSFSKPDNGENINKNRAAKQIETVKVFAKPVINIKATISPSTVNETTKFFQKSTIAEQIQNNKSKIKITAKPSKAELDQNIQVVKQKHKTIALVPVVTKADKAIIKPIKPVHQADDIPFLSTLDYNFRRTVPIIDINVYVYTENKADRFIMIEMKKYVSGQEISPGMTLKEIRINSLVVEYKDRVFQIQRN